MDPLLKKKNNSVAYWLLSGAFLVALMVVLGGITRLTHSGLSMVTWKPITGILPPLSEQQWLWEFQDYQTSPEYLQKNYHFTLAEFKSIFWWEYFHRLLGRIIGLVFIIPFIYFLITKKLEDRTLRIRLMKLFFLGLAQGIIGWLMVKSGLVDAPHVSHYRLTLHLIMAFVLFGYLLWTALTLLYPQPPIKKKKAIDFILFLLLVQIIYGAFLAGLQAGTYYGTFPKMGDEWLPSIITETLQEKGILSLFDFGISVQFIHRWMAVLVVSTVLYIFVKIQKNNFASKIEKTCSVILLSIVIVQFLLGVFTLIYGVPLFLAVAHQIMALALFGCLVITKYVSRHF